MAALTSSNVRTIRAWTEGGLTGKRRSVRRVEVHGGSWGGVTNTMPATAFGLRLVEEVTPAVYGTKTYPTYPSTDGTLVYLSTAFDTAPADLTVAATTGGMYFTVKGY